MALSVLVVGVVTAQSSQKMGSSVNKGNVYAGVVAALGVSVCSGFASVYLEKILKGDKTSIWVRNVQLCLFSIPLQLLAVCRGRRVEHHDGAVASRCSLLT